MNATFEQLLIVVLAVNFLVIGAGKLRTAIHGVAIQGALVGALPLLMHDLPDDDLYKLVRTLVLSGGTIILKGIVVPACLIYAKREADIRHEARPTIGSIPSLFLATIGISLSVVLSRHLIVDDTQQKTLLVPASLATAFCGFLILTTRKMAINQVVGYLVLENGVYLFGMLLLDALPALVEIGALLDLFTGVFVMGIIIHQINREFASISTEYLTELKD
jgi:hydrogenase-4 component E